MNNHFRILIYGFAAVAMLASFILLYSLPIQLIPNLKNAKLTVESYWPNASSSEMISEVMSPMAQTLLQLKRVKDVVSFSGPGYGYTELVFASSEDAAASRQEVNALLSGLTDLPADAKAPYISDGDESHASGWVLFSSNNAATPASDELDYVERIVLPQVRKIEGINNAYILNKQSLQKLIMVDIDFAKLRRLELSILAVTDRLSRIGNLSLGEFVSSGKTFGLRLDHAKTLEDVKKMLFPANNATTTVSLSDFAQISLSVPEKVNMAYYNGQDVVPIVFYIRDDADLFAIYQQLNRLKQDFNQGILTNSAFQIDTFGDPTPIIDNTRDRLVISMLLGIFFTIVCILTFYRKLLMSLDILIYIPFTFFAILLIYWLFNIPLNIISVTGVAIATGVILDPAIIITEHFKHQNRPQGTDLTTKPTISQSLLRCIVLASSTSILVFLPILTMDASEAKIFSDLGISFICAIIISTLLPLLLSPRLYQQHKSQLSANQNDSGFAVFMTKALNRLSQVCSKRWLISGIGIVGFAFGTHSMFPTIEYLPQISNDTATFYFRVPQSTPPDKMKTDYIDNINQNLAQFQLEEQQHEIFLRSWSGGGYGFFRHGTGVSVDEYLSSLSAQIKSNMTQFRSAVLKTNLTSNYGGEKSITIDIIGADEASLAEFVAEFQTYISAKSPDLYITTNPELNNSYDAISLRIRERELLRLNIDEQILITIISASCSGVYTGDVMLNTVNYGLYVRPTQCRTHDEILNTLIPDRQGNYFYVADVVEQRSITLPQDVMLKNNLPAFRITAYLGSDDKSTETLAMLKAELNLLVQQYKGAVSYELAEDSKKIDLLKERWATVFVFVLALNVLLVALLCRSVSCGLMMFLGYIAAMFGAIACFNLVGLFVGVSFDVITLLGGVLMIGIVSNGFIILAQGFVHEARNKAVDLHQAMANSVSMRLRPIVLTTLSTVSAMLPLILSTDETAILYRGLASVLIGGIVFGSLISITLLPSLTVSIYKRLN